MPAKTARTSADSLAIFTATRGTETVLPLAAASPTLRASLAPAVAAIAAARDESESARDRYELALAKAGVSALHIERDTWREEYPPSVALPLVELRFELLAALKAFKASTDAMAQATTRALSEPDVTEELGAFLRRTADELDEAAQIVATHRADVDRLERALVLHSPTHRPRIKSVMPSAVTRQGNPAPDADMVTRSRALASAVTLD